MAEPIDRRFTTTAMTQCFAASSHVRHILAFEAALARAEADAGIIPRTAAEAITAACQATHFDIERLYDDAALAGTLAIPLVHQLTAHTAEPGRAFVHWGATSQDAIDTALVLQMRAGLELLETDTRALCTLCADLARQHRRTLMAGRTLLQQALPITFGLKAARWLALMVRQLTALRRCQEHSLALQFGGAAGTLAALGTDGLRVAELLAAELQLALPELPWHAERDRVATVATTLGIIAGSVAKIAGDLALLMQTEVGEVSEAAAPGKGGSSAMPHKRNPVDVTLALAAARLALGGVPVILAAMAQEHERAVGGWQAEWAAIPDLFCHTAAALSHLRSALTGLEIDPARMRENLERDGGLLLAEALTMALTPQLGRVQAHSLVTTVANQARATGQTLRQAAGANSQISALLTPDAIARALDPMADLGSSDALIDRALESFEAL